MIPYQLPETISFNFEELKAGLLEKVSVYEAMVYSDEQISAAKADRANLNRLKKALNDERIKQEREYMQPFSAFKAQINEIISIIDKPVAAIDKQVKQFEEQQKAEKKQKIEAYWHEVLQAEKVPAGICFSHIFNEKMLNASVSMKSIQEAIDAKLVKFAEDLAVIRALPSYGFEAEQVYISSLDLAKAVSEAHRLSELAERKAAYEAEQAKRKTEHAARMEAADLKPTPKPEPVPEQPTAPKLYTVSFRATMTIEQARELRDFFMSRGIEYEKI